jgi:hypothetical protein
MSIMHRMTSFHLLLVVILTLSALSCKDYEYLSPEPGILEIRLKVTNNRQDLIPFGSSNQWIVLLKDLNGLQPGGVQQRIYGDVHSIRRTPDGDPLNALDFMGRDSGLVMGAVFASPLDQFVGINFTVNFSQALSISRNGLPIPNVIQVNSPAPPAPASQTFFALPESMNLALKINSGRVTRITVGMNLDSVLVRRAESFELHPSFFISSVQNF